MRQTTWDTHRDQFLRPRWFPDKSSFNASIRHFFITSSRHNRGDIHKLHKIIIHKVKQMQHSLRPISPSPVAGFTGWLHRGWLHRDQFLRPVVSRWFPPVVPLEHHKGRDTLPFTIIFYPTTIKNNKFLFAVYLI